VNVGNIYHNIRTIAIYTVQGILSRASKALAPKENSGSRLFFLVRFCCKRPTSGWLILWKYPNTPEMPEK